MAAHWLISILAGLVLSGQSLPFFCSELLRTSPSDELRCLYADHRGMLWIGTNSGLKSYDGYNLQTVPITPDGTGTLPSKTILSITEDPDDNLWLGTRNGLVRLDRKNGLSVAFHLDGPAQENIYTLYTASDGTVWIGTDGGLTRYEADTGRFTTYGADNAWVILPDGTRTRPETYGVKSIVETPDGDLFIGTWSSGLLRFDPKEATFRAYPAFNPAGSAFALMLDSRERLWIGTWGQGLFILDQPFDEEASQIRCIVPAAAGQRNFTRIVEDTCGGVVWAGDIDGICLFDLERPEAGFRSCLYTGDPHQRALRYCSDIVADRWGNVWLGMLYDGIFHVNTQNSPFQTFPFSSPGSENPRSSVSAIFTEDGERLWMGLLPFGIALQDRTSGKTLFNRQIPGFAQIRDEVFRASVSAIIHRPNGEIWIGTKGNGIIVSAPDGKASLLTGEQADFLNEDYVNALYCDRYGYTWVGQRAGLALVAPDGSGQFLSMRVDGKDLSRSEVHGIIQDREGSYWISTENQGILRIEGKPKSPRDLQIFQYSRDNGNYVLNGATACFEDHGGTLWAISNGGGLARLNRLTNRFEDVTQQFRIDRDRIIAINEDLDDCLWLTVDDALIRLKPSDQGESLIRWYSREDGLGEILFSPNAIYRFGNELFFGSRNGYFTYTRRDPAEDGKPLRLSITDLSVDGVSYAALPPELKAAVSDKYPMFAREINIPASVREFRLDFSLLSHMGSRQNSYAYLLGGYDRDWHYLNRGHSATYQNLPAGTYQFRLKAAGPDGRWQEMGYPVTFRIQPPWYATWWAKLLYLLSAAGLIAFLAHRYNQRLRSRHYRQMNAVLTNITHELLTPLAVISGSVEEIRKEDPTFREQYSAIDNNISRISRLLRQILEIRKSDAGKLKLQVSEGDLAAFIRQECRNILPMAVQRNITLQTPGDGQALDAWFDRDKLDKIFYNLVSNAIKYNREGGRVGVALREDGPDAVLTVSDNGIGIPKAKMKDLYSRFLDGDYRKTNETGTGLGLALTRELVRLHHGSIHCESEEGKGTSFTVRLPVRRKAYSEAETDPSPAPPVPASSSGPEPAQPEHTGDDGYEYAMLIVEDNTELLELMGRTLSRRFRVWKAHNGIQALSIIRKEELDIVISDVMMPQMGGLELTRQIKESEDYSQLPVILLTARTEESDRTAAYVSGADEYLTKPFSLEALELRVDNILKNRERVRRRFCRQTSFKVEDQHYSSPDGTFVQRAMDCVINHLTDADYDRESFAADMCISSSSLYNKLRAITGQNISGFINSIRLKEACRIAQEEPGIQISELADRVGYNSPRYFTMCFKKEFGIPPKEYLGGLIATTGPANGSAPDTA